MKELFTITVLGGEQGECPDTPEKIGVWAEVHVRHKSPVSTAYYFSYTGNPGSILERLVAKTFNIRHNVPAFGVEGPTIHVFGSSRQEILKNFPDPDEIVSIKFLTSEEAPCMTADNTVLRPGAAAWFPDIRNNLVKEVKYVPGMTEGPLFSYRPNADQYLVFNRSVFSLEQACKALDDVSNKFIVDDKVKRLFRRELCRQVDLLSRP